MRSTTRRLIVWLIGLGYGSAAAILLLWPDGEQVRQLLLRVYFWGLNTVGLPLWFNTYVWAALANFLLLLPLAFAAVLVLGRRRWWLVALAGVLLGVAVELIQARAGMTRVPEVTDSLLNGAGAVVGAGLGVAMESRLGGRRNRANSPGS